MGDVLGIILDVTILIALGATIVYSIKLSRQFNKLQADKVAFEALIKALNLAAGRAENAIQSLKETATQGADNLQEKISKGRGISDELEIIIQAGDSLANRLESLAEQGTKTVKTSAGRENINSRNDTIELDDGEKPKTKAEQELLAAIKAKQK